MRLPLTESVHTEFQQIIRHTTANTDDVKVTHVRMSLRHADLHLSSEPICCQRDETLSQDMQLTMMKR